MAADPSSQDDFYRQAAESYGAALKRLARAYEVDAEARRDLLQEIHIALWRSFAGFNGRCSLRTWIYRVAHNVATSHITRRRKAAFVGLEELESLPVDLRDHESAADRQYNLVELWKLSLCLKPIDRQVILSSLEGFDAASIGEVTGISPGNVSTKVHRIKNIMARRFQNGE